MLVVVVRVAGLADERGGEQLHAALGAMRRFLAGHLGVHRAGVGGRRGQQLHAAVRAAAGLFLHDVGVHRAGIDDRPLRHPHIHLGDERERLVRLCLQESGEPVALGGQLGIAAQLLEALGQRWLGRLLIDRDRRQRIHALGRVMLQREHAGLLEEHVDDHPLGRSQHDLLDETLLLDAAAVTAGELHARPGQLDLEHARVGRIGQDTGGPPRRGGRSARTSVSPATSRTLPKRPMAA